MTISPKTLALRAIKQYPTRLGCYTTGPKPPGAKHHSIIRNNWQTGETFKYHSGSKYQVQPAENLVKMKD